MSRTWSCRTPPLMPMNATRAPSCDTATFCGLPTNSSSAGGRFSSRRVVRIDADPGMDVLPREPPTTTPTPSASATATANAATATSRRVLDAGGAGAPGSPSIVASSIANRASAMSARRCLGSFRKHRRRSVTIDRGNAAGNAVQSGSSRRIAASVSDASSRANAGAPVSISYSTQPNIQMSARGSSRCPRVCSGLMYATVPRIVCSRVVPIVAALDARTSVDGSSPPAVARPKSSTFTTPSGVILMLAGLRSLWTMPLSCAASSASAICRAMARLSGTGIGPSAMRWASVGPSTSSSTRARTPPLSSRP